MLIVTALNVTGGGGQREDGMSDYLVEVAINHQPPIFKGSVNNHFRANGAATLLRRIADRMDGVDELLNNSAPRPLPKAQDIHVALGRRKRTVKASAAKADKGR